MSGLINDRPVVLLIILAGLTALVARLIPSTLPISVWIIFLIGLAMGLVMVARPDRSGVPAHPTGVRLVGIFILGLWACLLAADLINFVQGA